MVDAISRIPRLTWSKALAWRLARHHMVNRASPADLLRVVADIGGLHAQVTSSAELSLWARIDGLDRAAVHDALWKERSLVKLWATRGTLYLLPAAEIGVWLGAIGTYTNFGNTGHPEIDALTTAVGEALVGQVLTREELATAVEAGTGSAEFGEWVRFSWGSYLKAASFRGLICFAPNSGNKVRFTSPRTWVPGGITSADSQDALRTITRRFLAAYAPASPSDLTRWWAGPPLPRRGLKMIAALGAEAVEVEIDGDRAWIRARDLDTITAATPVNVARLLPAFDPWTIGAARRVPALLDPSNEARIYRNQGWISPVVLVNGRMDGVWKHTRRGRRLLIEIEPFVQLPRWAKDQLETEAERMAMFYDCGLDLAWRPPGHLHTNPRQSGQSTLDPQ